MRIGVFIHPALPVLINRIGMRAIAIVIMIVIMRITVIMALMVIPVIMIMVIIMVPIIIIPVIRFPGIPVGRVISPVPWRMPNRVCGNIDVINHRPTSNLYICCFGNNNTFPWCCDSISCVPRVRC